MRVFLCIILFQYCILASSTVDKIGHYILSDVQSTVEYTFRMEHDNQQKPEFEYWSRFEFDVTFPKVFQYFNIDPRIEFLSLIPHSSGSNSALSRVGEAHLNIGFLGGFLSVGDKRLSLQKGRFLSGSSFGALPRIFRQLSFSDNHFSFYYLTQYNNSNSIDKINFDHGSVIVGVQNIELNNFLYVDAYLYFFDDIHNIYTVHGDVMIDSIQSLSSTVAFQDLPSIGKNEAIKRSYYVDLIYSLKTSIQELVFGIRMFGEGHNEKVGFRAPFSSSHSWDGYTNRYQPSIKLGFLDGHQTYFGSFSTRTPLFKQVGIQIVFFNSILGRNNLGKEINIWISKDIILNHLSWSYKLGQFFSGGSQSQPSELNMWLDFKLFFGEII